MRSVNFTVRLKSDTVVSERSATTGGHRCLDFLPGSAFLGACAAGLYDGLGADAFTAFHSGLVRFGNAYPVAPDGSATLPIPLSWHLPKGKSLAAGFDSQCNLVLAAKEDFASWEAKGEQQKQVRSGFFSDSGQVVQPENSYRLKTALDRESGGRAADAQLFGYQSLKGGSLWRFTVEFDAAVSAELERSIVGFLSAGEIHLGRSRSAEYGAAKLERQDKAYDFGAPVAGPLLVIYCLSDLALQDDATGIPTLNPEPGMFGLTSGAFQSANSFLRTRSYTPFNGKRRRSDLERQVIAKGSVLVFSTQGDEIGAGSLAAIAAKLASGVGLYRQDGLGKVLVNPGFLMEKHYRPVARPDTSCAASAKKGTAAPPALAGWLNSKVAAATASMEALQTVTGWLEQLGGQSNLPSNSQWSALRGIALAAKNEGDLHDALLDEKGHCCHGVSQKQWGKQLRFGASGKITYKQFLEEEVLCEKGEQRPLVEARQLLYLLGNRVPRIKNQKSVQGGAE